MNTPNPLVPQGSLLEQKAKGKPHLRIAIFIVAIHVVFLGGLLIQGCKKEEPKTAANNEHLTGSGGLTSADTNQPVVGTASNLTTDPYATSPIAPPSALPLATTSAPPVLPTAAPVDTTAATGGLPPQPMGVAQGGVTEHTVERGDSFYTLAKKYNVSMKAIAAANPGVDSSRLKLKQKLVIPAAAPKTEPAVGGVAPASETASSAEKSYKVKPNDNLSKIAKAHGVTVRELQAANNLKSTRINVGEKLVIPAPKGKVATAETAALSTPIPAPVPSGTAPTFSTPAPSLPAPTTPGLPPAGTNR